MRDSQNLMVNAERARVLRLGFLGRSQCVTKFFVKKKFVEDNEHYNATIANRFK